MQEQTASAVHTNQLTPYFRSGGTTWLIHWLTDRPTYQANNTFCVLLILIWDADSCLYLTGQEIHCLYGASTFVCCSSRKFTSLSQVQFIYCALTFTHMTQFVHFKRDFYGIYEEKKQSKRRRRKRGNKVRIDVINKLFKRQSSVLLCSKRQCD